MAIPDFQSLMLPLMQHISDGKNHEVSVVTQAIGEQLRLTPEEWAEMLPSGRAPLFYNRLAWAKTHLKRAGLLDQPKRGVMVITPAGQKLLSATPQAINLKTLQAVLTANPSAAVVAPANVSPGSQPLSNMSPEETLERAHVSIRSELALDLLNNIKQCSPEFFEELVVKLMLKMGYGGTRAEAGKAVGRTGDGGIDGFINEDRLGLDTIYLQAKRWAGSIGSGEIRDFIGALVTRGAQKGVFITTSGFTKDALEAVKQCGTLKIVLIDGARLADLMIEHDLGVSVEATFHLKRIDSDFFSDE